MNRSIYRFNGIKIMVFILVISAGLIGLNCGDSSENKYDSSSASSEQTAQAEVSENNSGLSDFQMENGIGPITEKLELKSIDKKLSSKGESIFNVKCAACHKLDERYVGPAQRDLVERRSPEYIMNMMMNPDEMLKKHPEAQKMLATYMTPMPNQNLTEEDARALLEYFRVVDKEKK